jgi:leucine dehydrogenase
MKIETLSIPSHETVLRVTDAEAGLTGFIAVHSTRADRRRGA